MSVDWPEKELDLWDLVPEEDRVCAPAFVHMLSRGDVSDQLWVRQVCSRPWCAPCEQYRTWRMEHRITQYMDYHQPQRIWMMTKSIKNEFRLIDAFGGLHECNRRFTMYDNAPSWGVTKQVFCWIATYEITYSERTGYHLHQHALIGTRGEDIPYGDWHNLWDTAAGYGAQLHFKELYDRKGAIAYISKYISKGCWGGLSRGRAYMVRSVLSGRNRIVTKHGTAVSGPDFPRFYLCCLPSDKRCASGLGGWDSPTEFVDEEGKS